MAPGRAPYPSAECVGWSTSDALCLCLTCLGPPARKMAVSSSGKVPRCVSWVRRGVVWGQPCCRPFATNPGAASVPGYRPCAIRAMWGPAGRVVGWAQGELRWSAGGQLGGSFGRGTSSGKPVRFSAQVLQSAVFLSVFPHFPRIPEITRSRGESPSVCPRGAPWAEDGRCEAAPGGRTAPTEVMGLLSLLLRA